MKPGTFADMVLNAGAELVEGFKSSAQNEGWAQVVIDRIMKVRWGASTEHHSMGGTKIREIAYPNSQSRGSIADVGVIYSRPKNPVPDQPFHINNFIDKNTAYFIEVKSESGGNVGRFSGSTWYTAFQNDIDKLAPVSQWISYVSFADETQGREPTKGRCFAVLLSYHPDTSGTIISDYANRFPHCICRTAMVGVYNFCVLVQQV